MESFSLLKYWKALAPGGANARSPPVTDTGAAGSGNSRAAETDDEGDDGGPFIDLEFAVPDENEADEEDDEDDDDDDEDDGSANVVVSDCTDGEEREVRLGLSSDAKDEDLFINGCSLVPLDSDSKHQLIPVSLLKSATKLRIFMLRFKKSKTVASANKADSNGSAPKSDGEEVGEKQKTRKEQSGGGGGGGFFTVKFKVEEVPIVSLFTRDNSSKKQSVAVTAAEESASDDKRSMQKYFRMVKPLGEKLRFSGQLKGAEATAKNESESEVCGSATATATATTAVENAKSSVKHGNIQAGLRVVYKHLGKSRSASSSAMPTPVSTAAVAAPSRRRDDSLLEQQDGIQSAILHCKRSFNGSRDSASGTNALLSRSSSDPSHGKSTELERDSSEETSRPATN